MYGSQMMWIAGFVCLIYLCFTR